MVLTHMQHMRPVMDMVAMVVDTAIVAMVVIHMAVLATVDTVMEWDTLQDMDGTTAQVTHITLHLLGVHLTMEQELDGGALISNIHLLKFLTSLLMKLIIQFSLAATFVLIMSVALTLKF